jgi:hypothetical protein
MAAPWTVRAEGEGLGRALDLAEARQALGLITLPASGVELFSLFPPRYQVLSGDDLDELVRDVDRHHGSVGNFVAVNPLPPDFRSTPGKGARVGDFTSRRWLAIDVDPVKPAKDQNATDQEHGAARELIGQATAFLTGKGAPDPLLIDTGGGWLALYRVDLPNDDDTRSLLSRFLKALAGAFDGAGATIDPGSARVTFHARLPGTWNRKGPHTSERPQRMVRLARIPATLELFPVQLLEELAGPGPAPRPAPLPFATRATGGEREEAYARAALRGECEAVASCADRRNNRLNDAAIRLGHFVGAGLLVREEVERELFAAACACGLDQDTGGERGIRATIKSGLDAGVKEPRGVPEERGPAPSVNGTNGTHTEKRPGPDVYDLPRLLAMDLPPPAWVVPGLLSEGLTILAGKPKLGKSWLALNLALTIAAGGTALGHLPVEPADVLYLSLEDRLRRIQDRARKVLAGLDIEPPGAVDIAVEWLRADKGGLFHLDAWLSRRKRRGFVIIDVWAKFRTVSSGSRSAYDQDYEHVSALKKVIDSHDASAMLVMHCKKQKADDVLDEVSGTLGLAGSTDGVLVLTRARSEREADLFVTGRDVEEQQLALDFDPKNFTWASQGTSEERLDGKYKLELEAIFRANPGTILSPKELGERMSIPEEKQASLRRILLRMADVGQVVRVGYGRYRWPVRSPEEAL